MTPNVQVGTAEIRFTTLADVELKFHPVKMARRPTTPMDWLNFRHMILPGSELSAKVVEDIRAFMEAHDTDALTTSHGRGNCFTLSGDYLAYCFPSELQ